MKFRFNGSLDEFIKKYSEARDTFNKENRIRGFELVVYLRAGKIEIGIEKSKNGGSYWFVAPIVEGDGYIELEGEIAPDCDMKMRWYEWIGFGLVFALMIIPLLIACIFTKSAPFSTKGAREKRLCTYMCKYLGCEKL